MTFDISAFSLMVLLRTPLAAPGCFGDPLEPSATWMRAALTAPATSASSAEYSRSSPRAIMMYLSSDGLPVCARRAPIAAYTAVPGTPPSSGACPPQTPARKDLFLRLR